MSPKRKKAQDWRDDLPTLCECGGKMLYDFGAGRVFSCCDTCSPVVNVKLPRPHPETPQR